MNTPASANRGGGPIRSARKFSHQSSRPGSLANTPSRTSNFRQSTSALNATTVFKLDDFDEKQSHSRRQSQAFKKPYERPTRNGKSSSDSSATRKQSEELGWSNYLPPAIKSFFSRLWGTSSSGTSVKNGKNASTKAQETHPQPSYLVKTSNDELNDGKHYLKRNIDEMEDFGLYGNILPQRSTALRNEPQVYRSHMKSRASSSTRAHVKSPFRLGDSYSQIHTKSSINDHTQISKKPRNVDPDDYYKKLIESSQVLAQKQLEKLEPSSVLSKILQKEEDLKRNYVSRNSVDVIGFIPFDKNVNGNQEEIKEIKHASTETDEIQITESSSKSGIYGLRNEEDEGNRQQPAIGESTQNINDWKPESLQKISNEPENAPIINLKIKVKSTSTSPIKPELIANQVSIELIEKKLDQQKAPVVVEPEKKSEEKPTSFVFNMPPQAVNEEKTDKEGVKPLFPTVVSFTVPDAKKDAEKENLTVTETKPPVPQVEPVKFSSAPAPKAESEKSVDNHSITPPFVFSMKTEKDVSTGPTVKTEVKNDKTNISAPAEEGTMDSDMMDSSNENATTDNKPTFSFGLPSNPPNTSIAPSSSFFFGSSNQTGLSLGNTPATVENSNNQTSSGFNFGISKPQTAPSETEQKSANPASGFSFSFGKPPEPAVPVVIPESKSESAPTGFSFSFGNSNESKPSSSNVPAPNSTSSFSFGSQKPSQQSTAPFAFGTQSNSQAPAISTFGNGSAFAESSTAQAKQNGFSFGAPSVSTVPTVSFGSNNTAAPNPLNGPSFNGNMNTFETTNTIPPVSNQRSTSFSFTNQPPPSSSNPQQQIALGTSSFTFGNTSQTSLPLAQSNNQLPPASFSFGGSSQPNNNMPQQPQAVFSFGPSGTAPPPTPSTPVQPVMFGSGPAAAPQTDGAMFSIGNSSTTGRRPIAQARSRKKR